MLQEQKLKTLGLKFEGWRQHSQEKYKTISKNGQKEKIINDQPIK